MVFKASYCLTWTRSVRAVTRQSMSFTGSPKIYGPALHVVGPRADVRRGVLPVAEIVGQAADGQFQRAADQFLGEVPAIHAHTL